MGRDPGLALPLKQPAPAGSWEVKPGTLMDVRIPAFAFPEELCAADDNRPQHGVS